MMPAPTAVPCVWKCRVATCAWQCELEICVPTPAKVDSFHIVHTLSRQNWHARSTTIPQLCVTQRQHPKT
jgi:hypothetical protein